MTKQMRLAALALTLVMAVPTIANAQLAPLALLDMMFKKSNKDARATPGHAEWCAKQRPGYRPEWNNWRTSDGRVTYCASPFYTPPWRKFSTKQ